MTDLEMFLYLLTKLNAVPTYHKGHEGKSVILELSKDGENIHGYSGFVTSFEFDTDGNIMNIGIYE